MFRSISTRIFLHSSVAMTMVLGGCSRYHAKPLDQSAVNQALAVPSDDFLKIAASKIQHPILVPVQLRPDQGLTPDEAAVIAVILNPSLRAQRDRRSIADAQTLQAGILPNPQLSANYDFVTGGNTAGTLNAYGFGVGWDVTSLISHSTKIKAAQAAAQSVNLDIAWQEWQVAEAAKSAVYDLVSLQAQFQIANEVDQRLKENADVVHRAADQGLKSGLDVAAADSAAQDAHGIVMTTKRDLEHQKLVLNRAMGFPPETVIHLRDRIELPDHVDAPPIGELISNLENHRLDLLGLKCGYVSEDQTLLAAVLDQFPKINIGFNRASDTTDVHTIGPAVTIDIPIFDRNQGTIANEKATREKLFDEYTQRVFEARSDVATALADIHSIGEQIGATQSALVNLQHLVDAYKQATDRGNADVLSYYSAMNNLSQKTLDVLKLKQQLQQNLIALEIAAGRYLPEPTTQPAEASAARIDP